MDVPELRFLYAYNQWANRRALTAAAQLTEEQLTRDLGTSHGSVFGTLAHILSWEWRWLGRWLGPAAVPSPDPSGCASLLALQTRWGELEQAQDDFLAGLSPTSLATKVTYENPPGTAWTYSLEHLLRHVVNHSTYHRGQVTTLLRQLGAHPVPTDILVFIDEGGGRQP